MQIITILITCVLRKQWPAKSICARILTPNGRGKRVVCMWRKKENNGACVIRENNNNKRRGNKQEPACTCVCLACHFGDFRGSAFFYVEHRRTHPREVIEKAKVGTTDRQPPQKTRTFLCRQQVHVVHAADSDIWPEVYTRLLLIIIINKPARTAENPDGFATVPQADFAKIQTHTHTHLYI